MSARRITSEHRWGLLGLVVHEPGYGYQLARRFDEFFDDLLPLKTDSKVHEGLRALQGRGLLERTSVVGPASSLSPGQLRPGFRASELGVESYVEHVSGAVDDSLRRWVLLARELALLASRPAHGLASIERCRSMVLERAPSMGRSRAEDSNDEAAALASRLVVELAGSQIQWIIDWLDYAAREFEELSRRNAAAGTP